MVCVVKLFLIFICCMWVENGNWMTVCKKMPRLTCVNGAKRDKIVVLSASFAEYFCQLQGDEIGLSEADDVSLNSTL